MRLGGNQSGSLTGVLSLQWFQTRLEVDVPVVLELFRRQTVPEDRELRTQERFGGVLEVREDLAH